jgi:hypothetical protein
MEFQTEQSLRQIHGISSIPVRRRSWFGPLRLALVTLSRRASELARASCDDQYLSQMTQSQLRDIGLRRVEGGSIKYFVPFGDSGA